MNYRYKRSAIFFAAVLILTSCSEAPKPAAAESKKEAEPPPQPSGPVSAKTAFYEMYKPARTWATDLLPLTLVSNEIPGIKNEGGKAAMWTAVFVSPSRREARTFTYAVASHGTTLRGVTVAGAQSWSGATAKSRPFQITQFVADSDVAYNAAFKKAEAWVKKHPGKEPAFYLGSIQRFPGPMWYILWGTPKSGYAAYIDATTGTVSK